MELFDLIGYTATICGSLQLIPELNKALKTHHLRDVSWGTLCLMATSSCLWFSYSMLKGVHPVAISAAINGIAECSLIYLKLGYDKRDRLMEKRTLKGGLKTETVKVQG